jgi:hypothetical protein
VGKRFWWYLGVVDLIVLIAVAWLLQDASDLRFGLAGGQTVDIPKSLAIGILWLGVAAPITLCAWLLRRLRQRR